MTQPIIEVQDLYFDYPGFRALNGVSFRIEAGSVTALVGANGAGKTTLLRCIAGLDMPVAGSVWVAGQNVEQAPRAVHRLMGYLSDSFGVYGDLSVAQGLEYAARAQGLTGSALVPAVQATARQLGLADKLQTLAGSLSRGQRQRLGIGQAIIHGPRLLILDEPASGLDPEARNSLAQLFLQLQAQGMSLLVSSHILAELEQYSSHMLVLSQGRVLAHRALQAEPAPTADTILHLDFVDSLEAAHDWLSQQPGVRIIQRQRRRIELLFEGEAQQQAELLAACVRAGLPLFGFSIQNQPGNLQQSYLKSLAVMPTD